MMTVKKLNDYFNKNINTYRTLANSGSVSELLLKLGMYGKRWMQWDWINLFIILFKDIDSIHSLITTDKSKTQRQQHLYYSILKSIDTTSELDNIFTNRQVLLSIVDVACRDDLMFNIDFKNMMRQILAHVFKKFPELWTMSWMFVRHKNMRTHAYVKQHKLETMICNTALYMNAKSQHDMICKQFIDLYFNYFTIN